MIEPGAVETGLGIHGQFAYINVPADVVCVKLSTWASPLDMERELLAWPASRRSPSDLA